MKLKRQIKSYECGVAVTSMVTGLPFDKCREQLGMVEGLGCLTSDIRRVLIRNGVSCQTSNVLSERCVLRLQNPASAQGSHFILRWDGFTYDPDKGRSKAVPAFVEALNLADSKPQNRKQTRL